MDHKTGRLNVLRPDSVILASITTLKKIDMIVISKIAPAVQATFIISTRKAF